MSAAQVPQISMNDLCSFSEAPTQRDSLQHLRDCSLSTHTHQFKNSWIPAFASKSRASKRHGLDHIFRSLAGFIPSKHHLPKKLMLGENFLNVLTEKNQWDGGKTARVLKLDVAFAVIDLSQYICNQLKGACNRCKGNTDGETGRHS